MSGLTDASILIRDLTGDPPDMAARATAYLESENQLLLTSLGTQPAAMTAPDSAAAIDAPR